MGRFVGFYNGSAGAEYDLGVTVSPSCLCFGAGRLVNARSEQQSPTILRDATIKGAPSPVRVDDEIFVYYDGYETGGAAGHIFLEVYDLDGNPRYRSITPVLMPNEVTGMESLARPSVTYDPNDATAPFKMVFSATPTPGTLNTSVWLATSPNGYKWTVLGQAFGTGAAPAWDSNAVITTGRMVKHNNTFHIFYGGQNGSFFQGGVATNSAFTPTGWVKTPNNPILTPIGAWNEQITGDIGEDHRWVNVADSSRFDLGAPIIVWNPANPASCEMNIVTNRSSPTQIGVAFRFLGNYAVAANTRISQIQSRSVDFSEVWYDSDDAMWKTLFTCFQFCPDGNRETVGFAQTMNLDSGFAIDPDVWPLALRPRSVVWDRYSAENLKYVQV